MKNISEQDQGAQIPKTEPTPLHVVDNKLSLHLNQVPPLSIHLRGPTFACPLPKAIRVPAPSSYPNLPYYPAAWDDKATGEMPSTRDYYLRMPRSLGSRFRP